MLHLNLKKTKFHVGTWPPVFFQSAKSDRRLFYSQFLLNNQLF